jgi:hypothetical protein
MPIIRIEGEDIYKGENGFDGGDGLLWLGNGRSATDFAVMFVERLLGEQRGEQFVHCADDREL